MSLIARFFWVDGNDVETDRELAKYYLDTYLEKNHINMH